MFADALMEDFPDNLLDSTSNDTNENNLYYLVCLIIQLVRLATSFLPVSHHSIKYPIIASSGSNFHMFSLKSMNF